MKLVFGQEALSRLTVRSSRARLEKTALSRSYLHTKFEVRIYIVRNSVKLTGSCGGWNPTRKQGTHGNRWTKNVRGS